MTLVAWANSENHLDKDNLVYLDSSAKAVACWGQIISCSYGILDENGVELCSKRCWEATPHRQAHSD